ncbi:MAG: hypothetical protein U9N09_00290, partial [Euryarchaeota archaeon]|nr:hypothetical protein [Euryarchaeota archaeon]
GAVSQRLPKEAFPQLRRELPLGAPMPITVPAHQEPRSVTNASPPPEQKTIAFTRYIEPISSEVET